MAGVGFELQKLIRKGTLVSTIQAFLYGSVLAAGPILLTMLTVGLIAWMSYGLFHQGVLGIFTVTVVYTFAFSLILTGPFQLVFTRYVADKHFAKCFEDIYPGFLTSVALVSGLALAAAIPFYLLLDVYVDVGNVLLYKLFGVLMFWGVCLIWQIMGFVSTTKEYQKVVWAYFAGTVVSIVLAYLLIPRITVAGAVGGFAAGQWLVAVLLFRIVTKPLKKRSHWRKEYFQYLRFYPYVALTGLFYNFGLWVDKFVFWIYFKEQQGASFFYTFNYYDVPNFLAFLTIIPALAYFLILTETNFYKDYSKFIDDVLHEPLLLIEEKKWDMIETLKRGLKGMLRLQGIVTLLLIVFAEPVLVFLGYRGVSLWLFRILMVGVFFHVVNLNLNIILLYYELRKQAFLLTLLFAVSNALLTLASLKLGVAYFGMGFLVSTLLTSLISWRVLKRSVQRIDFLIFASQPLESVVQIEDKKKWRRFVKKMRDSLINGRNIQPEYYS